jgi:glycosyltransferase involved in cell wall biosynthesis
MHSEVAGLVTIVMPAFNRENFIAEAINSVRNQTYPHWKLVIVDDGSTDNTVHIAKRLAQEDRRIEIIELSHSGEANARNTALSHADSKTEFIAFLDSDDVWDSDALQTLIDSIRLHENCVGAHGVARITDSNGMPHSLGKSEVWPALRKRIKGFFPRKVVESNPTDFSMLVYSNYVPLGATLVRKWVFDKVGTFNKNTLIYPDWEIWMRISSLGPFAFINKELYKYRIHAGNIPKPAKMIFAQEKQFFSNIYKEGNLTAEQQITLKQGYRMHQLYHGMHFFRSSVKKFMRGRLSDSVRELLMALDPVCSAFAFKPFDERTRMD